jgi:hypothetical protein
MLTDSKHLFDSISHSTHTKERRIMIDIATSKRSFERAEISDLGLVATEDTLADCFTKVMDPKQIRNAMDSGFLLHDIKQWIVRNI